MDEVKLAEEGQGLEVEDNPYTCPYSPYEGQLAGSCTGHIGHTTNFAGPMLYVVG